MISLALMGLYGASKHHQVTLFFYMIILFCLFIVQVKYFNLVACSFQFSFSSISLPSPAPASLFLKLNRDCLQKKVGMRYPMTSKLKSRTLSHAVASMRLMQQMLSTTLTVLLSTKYAACQIHLLDVYALPVCQNLKIPSTQLFEYPVLLDYSSASLR